MNVGQLLVYISAVERGPPNILDGGGGHCPPNIQCHNKTIQLATEVLAIFEFYVERI